MSFSSETRAELQADAVRAQGGDEAAFGRLFDLLIGPTTAYIARRAEAETVEDIVSDAWLKVVKYLPNYRPQPKVPFSAWVFRILQTTLVDHYRTKAREKEYALDMEDEYWVENILPDAEPNPAQALQIQYTQERIHQVLTKLPRSTRDIVELFYLRGFSHAEIAHITGKTEGHVRVMKLRGLRALRAYLAADGT